jgi:hypothetical protein
MTEYPKRIGKYGDEYPMEIVLSVEPDKPDTAERLDAIRKFMSERYPEMPFKEELTDHVEMFFGKRFSALSYSCLSDEMFDNFEDGELFERRMIDEIDFY